MCLEDRIVVVFVPRGPPFKGFPWRDLPVPTSPQRGLLLQHLLRPQMEATTASSGARELPVRRELRPVRGGVRDSKGALPGLLRSRWAPQRAR